MREHEVSTGALPTGSTSEQAAAANVQQMFDTIAPTYDRANHTLSAGIDRYWWTRAARTFRTTLVRPEANILDLCCGTGDMTLALYKHRPKPTAHNIVPPTNIAILQNIVILSGSEGSAVISDVTESPGAPSMTVSSSWVGMNPVDSPDLPAPILAIDFSHQMLTLGAKKFTGHNIIPIEADALHLPIASNSLDLITSAFGFRNLANYEAGLAELHRVLRPGGQIGILDCNQPEGLVGALYNLYFKKILPKLGGLISGQSAAYSYLPASVERFPRPARMLQLIRNAGFTNATWTSYTLGTAGLYRATKL
jgi:demethylmenaquinone methyltransferase / 2-methoxy-6-polyprenyl-1,4-benzoquinol methylase